MRFPHNSFWTALASGQLALVILYATASALADSPANDHPASGVPRVNDGVLDLRGHDFAAAGPVELTGDWEFHWKQFVPPDAFSRDRAGGELAPARSALARLRRPLTRCIAFCCARWRSRSR